MHIVVDVQTKQLSTDLTGVVEGCAYEIAVNAGNALTGRIVSAG